MARERDEEEKKLLRVSYVFGRKGKRSRNSLRRHSAIVMISRVWATLSSICLFFSALAVLYVQSRK